MRIPGVLARRTHSRTLAAVLTIAFVVGLPAATRKFYDDDPVSRVRDTQNASKVQPWEISLTYDSIANLFDTNPAPAPVRAEDVNTIDEVPDSSWFVNRTIRTPEEMTRGVDEDTGPAPGQWTVRTGKGNGVSPGFTIVDSRGKRYFVKFDPPDWNELATGAEVVVTRLYHALGYYVPQTNVAFLRRQDLVLDPAATTTGMDGKKRRMRESDIESNLRRAARMPDGRYRAIVSEALPGQPLGGYKYVGTRPDDPNDVIPHENRRSLRSLRVFGAWVDHRDAKAINSLDTLIQEGDRAYVRHHLLDFGSTLGSAGIGPRDARDSFEYIVDMPATRRALPAFGFAPRPWMSVDYPDYALIGRFESAAFDPDAWKPRVPNPAFLRARADDLFWGARRLRTIMTDEMIRAAVKAGQYTNPQAADAIARTLIERRDKIVRAWLAGVNPVVDVALAQDGRLTFGNAAVDARVAPAPSSYVATWSRFDNTSSAATAIGETRGASPMTPPAGLPSAVRDFVQVDIRAEGGADPSWAQPVHAWFTRTADGWKLVGFERMP